MKNEDNSKKPTLFVLIIITFIIVLVCWRLLLKIFPPEKKNGDNIFLNFFQEGEQVKNELEKTFEQFKNLNLPKTSDLEPSEMKNQGEAEKENLTNEQAKKMEEKILEYLNQTKKQ